VGAALLSAAAPVTAAHERARAAGCGGVERFSATADRNPGPPPLAVGDSVMLGAVDPLRRSGFEIDVRGCRQFSEGLSVLRARNRAGTLPSVVVVGLGTNWTITTSQIRAGLRVLGRERVLGLLTPREVGGVRSSDQAVIRAAGERWPRRVKVLDWVAYSSGHYNWFWSDGLHLQPRGGRALARLMRRAFTWDLPVIETSWMTAPPRPGEDRLGPSAEDALVA